MTFDVEIVLRERNQAVTERVVHSGNDAAHWTETDVEAVLKGILLAIDRVKNPQQTERFVALRGFSWIVEPMEGGSSLRLSSPWGRLSPAPSTSPSRCSTGWFRGCWRPPARTARRSIESSNLSAR